MFDQKPHDGCDCHTCYIFLTCPDFGPPCTVYTDSYKETQITMTYVSRQTKTQIVKKYTKKRYTEIQIDKQADKILWFYYGTNRFLLVPITTFIIVGLVLFHLHLYLAYTSYSFYTFCHSDNFVLHFDKFSPLLFQFFSLLKDYLFVSRSKTGANYQIWT